MMPRILQDAKSLLPDRHPLRLAWHRLKAFAAALRYGFPARSLTVIGITGTDGKTTTVAMTAHILHAAGIPVGAVSTSFFRIKGDTEGNPTHKTSLSPFAMQSFLRRCVHEGCSHVVVECSSHGLVQHRLDFLWPRTAAITNTSLEHLDYHGTMEQYRADKAILFTMLRGRGSKILNGDDATAQTYRAIPSSTTTVFSAHSPQPAAMSLWLTEVRGTPATTIATVHLRRPTDHTTKEERHVLTLGIPGLFNLENALCAIGCAMSVGIPFERCVAALSDFLGVPGRLEKIEHGQPFSVYVDFTVSPAAYQKTLSSIRASLAPGKRLLVLTGSCGNRMPEKRPMIGRIVSELADLVVVTEDETITEDQHTVIDEVWAGIDQSKTEAHKIFDRREGIRFLFKNARPGDAVALCGMGACTTMQTREGLREWDEREVARELLRSM